VQKKTRSRFSRVKPQANRFVDFVEGPVNVPEGALLWALREAVIFLVGNILTRSL
jgi:hypothetical protein